MKKVTSFRLDPELLAKVEKAGLNKTQIVEAALAKAVKQKKCPYCGNPTK